MASSIFAPFIEADTEMTALLRDPGFFSRDVVRRRAGSVIQSTDDDGARNMLFIERLDERRSMVLRSSPQFIFHTGLYSLLS